MSLALVATAGTITFGSTTGYGLYGETRRAFTTARRIVRDSPASSANPYVDSQVSGEIEWTLSQVRVTGTSADDLALLLANLNAILTSAGTVTDSLAGSAHSVTWTRNPSLPFLAGRTQHLEARSVWEGDVTFYTTTLGYEASAALYADEAIVGPALLSVGTLTGDAPAPLTIEVEAGWDTSSSGIRDCYVGITRGGTLTDYQYDAEDATASGSWVAADDGMKTNEPTTWDILDFGVIPAGRYRVVSRSKIVTSATCYLALSEDGFDAYQVTQITSDTYKLYDLGEFISDGTQHLFLLGKGSDWVYCEKVVFFPLEDQVTSFNYEDTGNIHSWQLGDALTLTRTNAYVIAARKYMVGERLTCPCTGRYLLVWCADDDGAEYDPAMAVSVSYTPQHYSWAAS